MPSILIRHLRPLGLLALLACATALPAQTPTTVGLLIVTRPDDSAADASMTNAAQLTGVRVRPEGNALRVILLLDRPVAFNVREERDGRRVAVDLIATRIAWLPPEVSRIEDDRLAGIWLRRIDDAVSTLELRLGADDVTVRHFSLTQPPAVVIELTPPAREAVAVRAPVIEASVPLRESVSPAGAVIPAPKSPPPVQLPERTPAPQAAPVAVAETPEEPTTTDAGPLPTDEPDGHELAAADFAPTAEDFEGFPIDAIQVSSPLAVEVYEDFVAHRWATALEKGLKHLSNNALSPESIDVLYLTAEARWRIGMQSPTPPFVEMANVWQQALRAHDSGRLAAFAHARLAQAALEMKDPGTAVYHLLPAIAGSVSPLRERLALQQARAHGLLNRNDEGLKILDALRRIDLADDTMRVELEKQTAVLRYQDGDLEGAWVAFEAARAIDPRWMDLDLERWEILADVAFASGRNAEALEIVQELLRNYGHRDRSQNYKLLLMHAELLERTGDVDVAERTYATVLREFSESLTGQAIQRATRQRYPVEVLESEGRYCLLLWSQGKILRAMAELHDTYQNCLREGMPTEPLQPIVQSVVPDFMRRALELGKPGEAIQAWRTYQHLMSDAAVRRNCAEPLSLALEQLGLYEDALAELDRAEGTPTARMVVRRAGLMTQLGRHTEARELLERPLPAPASAAQQAEADLLLARTYESLDMPLAAAQAYQRVAQSPGAVPALRGQMIVTAQRLYREEGLPMQTIELGVQALMLEAATAASDGSAAWDGPTAAAIRLSLAQAYFDTGDYERAAVILGDLPALPATDDDLRGAALVLLAGAYQRLEQEDRAAETCTTIMDDTTIPQFYREQARQLREILQWNADNPRWAVAMPAEAPAERMTP